jgi:hypothetical protein
VGIHIFDIKFVNYFLYNNLFNLILFRRYIFLDLINWGLGIGDWGLGIGDWAQSPIPNPQLIKFSY